MFRALAAVKNYTPSGRVRIFIFSVMALVAPLFIYFSLHVTSRTRYFNDRNFRQLRNLSTQISGRVDSLGTVFSYAVDKFIKPSPDGLSADPKEFQNYLDVLRSDGTVFSGSIATLPTASERSELKVTIEVQHEDSARWLKFESSSKSGTIASAKTNLDDVIAPLLNKGDEGQSKDEGERDFDHIVIARADNGKTLFEQANGDLNLTSLEHVHLADAPDKTLDLKSRSQTTDNVDVTIAGARYKLYVQPIEIALSTKGVEGQDTLWVICGLVDASRFRYQTWAISYTVLIVSGFGAGLLLLGWFFLKLLFIGPKDRLRPTETLILAVSVVIAASLVTLLVLFVLTYRNLENTLDYQLKSLATSVKEHFDSEVEDALQQIDRLDAERNARNYDILRYNSRPSVLKEICKDGKCKSPQNPYPYFKSVFWVGDAGNQIEKWSINKRTTTLIDVGTREYFTRIRNGYSRDWNGDRFWVEPVVSKNTGGFTVAISKAASSKASPQARVVVLDTNLMSLMKSAMVAGFGYRIIKSDGEVLFPNLKENFFDECDNDPRLRSAVSGRLNDSVSVPYVGRDARVYVTPMARMPDWTLVVFRDKEPLRSGYLELVSISTTLFAIYLTVFLLLLIVMFLAAPVTRSAKKWLWPSPNSSAIYLQSIPVSILLCLVAYLLSYRLSDRMLIVVLSLLSIAGVLLLMVQLKHHLVVKRVVRFAGLLEGLWSKLDYRFLFILCLVPLVFLLGVLPSIAFFRLTYDEEMDLFTKYGQVTLVNSLNEREARLRASYPASLFQNKEAADTFLDARLKEPFDRYYQFFFGTEVSNGSRSTNTWVESSQEGLLVTLRRLLPFASQSSVIRHGLVASHSADGLWTWRTGPDGKLLLQAPQESPTNKTVNLATTTYHFWLRRLSWFYFLCLLVFILFLLIRFVVKRVFLLDVLKLSKSDTKPPIPSGAWKRFVVLGSPYTRRNQLAPEAEFKVLNLKTEAADADWLQKFDLETFLKDAKSIAVDCFEYQFDQPQQNLQKLTLLEKLLTHEGTVLVSSTADPSDYLFEIREDNGSNNRRITDASARWAGIMSNFWIHYLEDNGDVKAFVKELRNLRRSRQRSDATPQIKAAEKELYKLLIRECAPRACLQDIGKAIARRWDFQKTSPEALVEEVLVQAATYYKFVWESCSRHEKLTLAHLAGDGFVSPNDPDFPHLVRRGFVVCDPEVRLMNESFRLFVLAQSRTDEDVAVTEGEARKSSSWQYLKIALSVAVIVVMVFLFATQRDLYNSTLLMLTSVAAGLPAIFNFFNLFQKNVAPPRPPS